jgi:hypothetical protein
MTQAWGEASPFKVIMMNKFGREPVCVEFLFLQYPWLKNLLHN